MDNLIEIKDIFGNEYKPMNPYTKTGFENSIKYYPVCEINEILNPFLEGYEINIHEIKQKEWNMSDEEYYETFNFPNKKIILYKNGIAKVTFG